MVFLQVPAGGWGRLAHVFTRVSLQVKQKDNGVALKCFQRVVSALDALDWVDTPSSRGYLGASLPHPVPPLRSSQSAQRLYNSSPPAIPLTHGNVHTSAPLSQLTPPSPCPAVPASLFSASVRDAPVIGR